MPQAAQMRIYDPAASIVFWKTKERFGGLSNMAPGFPLRVNGVPIRTSEALYQACRFPLMPDLQRQIIDETSPMTAKMRGKPFREHTRSDWDSVRVKIMRWCLRVKLTQNWDEFGTLLLATGDRPIVEQSRRDDFWGAKVADDGTLVGTNALGRLLMEVREHLSADTSKTLRAVEPPAISEFLLFAKPIETVWGDQRSSQLRETEIDHPPPISAQIHSDPIQASIFDDHFAEQVDARAAHAGESGRDVELEPYTSYRESGAGWLEHVPAHWEMRKLRHILRSVSKRYRPELPLLSVVRERGVIVRDILNKDENHNVIPTDLTNYKVVEQSQFAMNKMKAWQGSYGVSDHVGIVSPAYFVFNVQDAGVSFFHRAIRSKAYVPFFAQASDGVRIGQWDLSTSAMREIPFLVPPPSEQAAIVRFLDHADQRIRRYIRAKENLIALLEEQRKRVTRETILSANCVELRLEIVADLVERPVKRDRNKSYTPVGLYNRGRGIFKKEPRLGGELGDSHFFWIEKGDLVISGQFAWEGAIALAGDAEHGCISSHRYPILRGKRNVLNTGFLLSYFQSDWGQVLLDHHSRGAAGRNRPLNARTLMKEHISLPSLQSQMRISEMLVRETQVRRQVKSWRRLLVEFRTRLIADVVTGKLDVREAADALPAEPDNSDAAESDCYSAEGGDGDRPNRYRWTEAPAIQEEMTA